MSFITAIGTATPANRIEQSTIAEFMVNAMRPDSLQARKIRAVFKSSGINFRYSVLDDYARTKDFSVYPNSISENFPGTDQRMQLYRQCAPSVSVKAVEDMMKNVPSFQLQEVTHLITVSCTGMYAPGLDIDLIKLLGLSSSIQRTCINFMGCYAAFNALKVADAFCRADANAKVLVVCTELCSLHFQPAPTDDNILSNALFGDGSAAVLVEGNTVQTKMLSLERFHNDIAFNGESDMAWNIGDSGFEMRLSSYIPQLIRDEISKLVKSLLARVENNIRYYALHPGGKKILEAIEAELGIRKEQNGIAYGVLQSFGNMSSATVVFVLKEIFERLNRSDNNALILGAAFGPGLTLESMLLKAHVN